MENKNWWEATVSRDVMQEDGTNKVQSEHYLVLSPSCTDAEKRIIDELAPSCTGSMKVTDIKLENSERCFPLKMILTRNGTLSRHIL